MKYITITAALLGIISISVWAIMVTARLIDLEARIVNAENRPLCPHGAAVLTPNGNATLACTP